MSQTPKIEIRKATASDVTVLALLGRVTYTQSHAIYIDNPEDVIAYCNKEYSVENLKKEIADQNTIHWLALVDGIPAGFAVLKLNSDSPHLDGRHCCKLQKIYVLEDFISKKIGKGLQDEVIKEARSLNFEELWLNTYYMNERAINFYKKSGYREVGEDDFIVEDKNYKQIVFAITL